MYGASLFSYFLRIQTILAINCGKTIIWDKNSLFWTPYPPCVNVFLAGLQENNFEIGGRWGQQLLRGFFAFLPLIYVKDCSYLFYFYLHAWNSPAHRMCPTIFSIKVLGICRKNLLWKFTMGICMTIYRKNLAPEFAVTISRGFLPWVFYICKQILFCIYDQMLFIWKQTFFTCE